MEQLKKEIAEILEVADLDTSKKFTDYDEWDSLAALSLLALLDSDYNKQMKVQQIYDFANIEEFCMAIIAK